MSANAAKQPSNNTNIWSTRQLVTMALMVAIGVILSFIEFPLLPGVTWLKFDASNMPAMVAGFAYGPGGGIAVGVLTAILHGLLMADFSGAVMNIIVVVFYVLPAALIYKYKHTFVGAIIALVVGTIFAVAGSIVGNLIITPGWLGVPVDAVIAMIWPVLVPFNLIKGIINSVLTLIIYKSISNLITPKKDQKKGRA
ncbi:ECF transporter S component [Anaerotardibacter muris]|uniref:ECF transporter S component n=1 Tax=Anaerotardibacter muris TaxID=2941505 RepID=UPI002041E429|nr:ECF transporter S component [Anaerotardibacter muris]